MIKKVIFDLDGTLWETRDSYLYAYKKICEDYKITTGVTDEEVLNCMGIKLEELLEALFSFVEDKKQLGHDALRYSIEYILSYPSTYSKDIFQLFKRLSKEYEISIISNCPRVYLETFYKVSNIRSFVNNSYTIEDGTKEEHITKITKEYVEKAFFIGDSKSDYDAIKDHKVVYFCYAKYGYLYSDRQDYSIDDLDDVEAALEKAVLKEEMLINYDYEILSSNDSNMTIIYRNDRNYFGFLDLKNEVDGQEVLNLLKQKSGKKEMMGPINGNTWYGYKISLDNFEFNLYPDCLNSPKILNLFLQNNFEVCHKYSSTLASINQRIWNKAKKIDLGEEFEIKIVQGSDCYNYLDDLYEVVIDAFADGDYYESISSESFKKIYIQNIKFCNPDLVMIYYKGKIIALNFCYEDLEKRFYVSKTTAIKKTYQSSKILLKLIDESYKMMTKTGHIHALYHFQNDRTKTLMGIAKGHVIKTKYYGLLRYKND